MTMGLLELGDSFFFLRVYRFLMLQHVIWILTSFGCDLSFPHVATVVGKCYDS